MLTTLQIYAEGMLQELLFCLRNCNILSNPQEIYSQICHIYWKRYILHMKKYDILFKFLLK